ncbi:hypothetical protein Cgig2_025421 [Carnegiea gigantea]|uniref:Uncharacterized protein n=1 Tax=Carnegiea gigantea TaxID=171969 RepID=A0A9Q1K0Z2_9CARY|nr:hypothetical protein Cgig2_025421 [Carnegiea gigantea]
MESSHHRSPEEAAAQPPLLPPPSTSAQSAAGSVTVLSRLYYGKYSRRGRTLTSNTGEMQKSYTTGREVEKLTLISKRIHNLLTEVKELDSSTSASKMSELESFIGLSAPDQIDIFPPKQSHTKGSVDGMYADFAGGIVNVAADGMYAGFAGAKNLGLCTSENESVLGKAQSSGHGDYLLL